MRAEKGDTIGTTDGRYGVVVDIHSDGRMIVAEAPDPEDDCPDVVDVFYITQAEVASIV
jgi:hypothetical protein